MEVEFIRRIVTAKRIRTKIFKLSVCYLLMLIHDSNSVLYDNTDSKIILLAKFK